MVCPECLEAYYVLAEAMTVADIFTQVFYLYDYVLEEDWYKQGYAIGKITKDLKGLPESLLIETEQLEQIKDTYSEEFFAPGGELPMDDTVILDEYDEVNTPKAYELFIEGFNSQLSSENYDFNECLSKFYSNELSQLGQYLT